MPGKFKVRPGFALLLIWQVISGTPIALSGQTTDEITEASSRLYSAERAYCAGDTVKAVKKLEAFAERYPENGATLTINKWLAQYYLEQNDTSRAIELLTGSLDLKSRYATLTSLDRCEFLNWQDQASVKADICVDLGRIYMSLGHVDAALGYLSLADTKYLPSYGGCANGMIMYRTKLSLDFADFYLAAGDTAQAINRLLDYFLSGEYYSRAVAEKLKTLLLTRYTQQEISAEVARGLHALYIAEEKIGSMTSKVLYLPLFGHNIRRYYADNSLEHYRKVLDGDKNLLLLKGE